MTSLHHESATSTNVVYKQLTNAERKFESRKIGMIVALYEQRPGRPPRGEPPEPFVLQFHCAARSRVSGAVLRRSGQSAVAAGAYCEGADPWVAGLGDARCDWCLRAR